MTEEFVEVVTEGVELVEVLTDSPEFVEVVTEGTELVEVLTGAPDVVEVIEEVTEIVEVLEGSPGPRGIPGPPGPMGNGEELQLHIVDVTPHPAYDDYMDFTLLFENRLV